MGHPGNRTVRALLMGCCLIFVVEVAVIGVGAFRFVTQSGQLKGSYRKLKRLHNRIPFPSEKNVEQAADYLDELEYIVGEYGANLKGDPFPAAEVDAAAFSARAQDVIERFQKKAELKGVSLSAAQEAGFAEYASGGAVPLDQDVPRLSRQLYSVERVADILVGSGVESIRRVSRDVFEHSGGQSRRRSAAGQVQEDASVVHPAGLYFIEQVGVSFTADEKSIWRVLEAFAEAPHFMVITAFSHSSTSGILSYSPTTQLSLENKKEAAYLSGGILTGEKAVARSERIIAGNELIQVDLVVDVFNFDSNRSVR